MCAYTDEEWGDEMREMAERMVVVEGKVGEIMCSFFELLIRNLKGNSLNLTSTSKRCF